MRKPRLAMRRLSRGSSGSAGARAAMPASLAPTRGSNKCGAAIAHSRFWHIPEAASAAIGGRYRETSGQDLDETLASAADPERKLQLVPAPHDGLGAADQGPPDLFDPLSIDRTGLATESI